MAEDLRYQVKNSSGASLNKLKKDTAAMLLQGHELAFFKHSQLAGKSQQLLQDVKRKYHVHHLVASGMRGHAHAASDVRINGIRLMVGYVDCQQHAAAITYN